MLCKCIEIILLQNTFSEEHLWRAAFRHVQYNKKHTVSCFLSLFTVIIPQFYSYTKILTLISCILTPVLRIPSLIPIIRTLIPIIPTLSPRIPTLIPIIPNLISRIPTPIPRIPTLIPRISRIPTLIPRISIIPFIWSIKYLVETEIIKIRL